MRSPLGALASKPLHQERKGTLQMDLLLATSIDFVVVGFALVMVADFVAGLSQLWKDSQPKEVCTSEVTKPHPQVEDVTIASAYQAEPPLKPVHTEAFKTPVEDDPWLSLEVTEQACCCHTTIATPLPGSDVH